MRGLFRFADDRTLFAVNIAFIGYDPKKKELHVNSEDGDFITIKTIPSIAAENMISNLYKHGMYDFSAYDAELAR